MFPNSTNRLTGKWDRQPLHHAAVALISLAMLSASFSVDALSTDIAQSPLYLGGQVPPNILYILDDSGSMNLSFVPDICAEWNTKRAKSSHYNTLYYNPNVTYQPPVDHNGASLGDSSFSSAKVNGYSSTSSTVNLSTSYRPTWSASSTGCTSGSGSNDAYSSTTSEAAYYYVFDENNSNCSGTATDEDCYDKVVVSSTSGPGGTDERINFANWHSYYRTRLMTAKAGSSLAFDTLTASPRVGYGKINQGASTIDGLSMTTIQRGVRSFSGSDRQQFFNWLFSTGTNIYTPLRKALDAAGQYYSWIDEKGPYSTTPGFAGGTNLSCRQNYTVLMTDGYWNSSEAATSGARNNNDGNAGTLIGNNPDGKTYTYSPVSPFTDGYSNTLADVGVYYWKRDLTNLTNNVPTNPEDPAFWQHMVTIGVGLGVPTAIVPSEAFAAIDSGAAIAWPDPDTSYTGTSNLPAGRADDLLHAAVNSRGGFYNAQSPDAFAEAMAKGLKTFSERTSSASAIATNSTRLDTDTFIYQAKYDSADWSGRILAFHVNTDGSVGDPVDGWDGTGNIPVHTSRHIYTHDGSSGVNFTWSGGISAAQQTALGSEAMLKYIRGDHSNELRNGGSYRNRSIPLGDIINSDPWFVGRANFGYSTLEDSSGDRTEGDSYVDFLASATYKNRSPMVYVGANDGMLHGFNALTGNEMFTYIPREVIPDLTLLANVNYTHRFYVDGSPRAGDAYIDVGSGKEWRTVLLGSTGAGSKSVFALDVTYPDTFTASNVRWEFTHSELGYTIGQASIVRLANDKWGAVFGNGYNSTSQTARLFIVDIESGNLITAIDTQAGDSTTPNGLATPVVVDTNGDRIADYVYAGDLLGNLWKFNITDSDTSKWTYAFKQGNTPKPLFKTVGPNNEVQPITAKPQVGRGPNDGTIVFFGTGKYFENGDNVVGSPADVMSFYGIYDNDAQVTRSDLLQQEIFYEDSETFTHPDTNEDFVYDIRLATNNAISNQKGWYIDLISPPPANLGRQGERVVSMPLIWEDRVIFTTLIPNADPCSWGGDSWLMEVDPLTGGRLAFSVFDLNHDNNFSNQEFVTVTVDGTDITIPVSGKKSKEGIIKTPGVVCADAACYKYSSGSSGDIEVSANAGTNTSGRQSWQQLK